MTLSLARRTQRFPERTAVVDISEERLYAPAETIHENRVSYAELSGMATRTAEHLSALGVGAGDTVCLVTRNRVASLALLFACRRLEAVFFPVSHWLTPVSVERPFDTLEPDLVVSEAAQRDLVRSIPFDRSVTLEELAEADRESIPDTDSHDAADKRPLLLLHGDDGRPVARYAARTLEWNCISAIVAWGLSGSDIVPLTAPLSSPDGLVRVALSVLYAGGTLLLDRAFDPDDTLTAIGDENATFLAGRNQALSDLTAESGFEEAADSLERCVVEGPMADDVRERYRAAGVPVARAYGRPECPTAFCQPFETAGGESTPADSTAGESMDVGYPVPDCRARLRDEDGRVLEGEGDDEGEVEGKGEGRLELAGPVVADGYVNAAGTDDEGGTATGEDRGHVDDIPDARGRFSDGWFETGERFRRMSAGRYQPT